MILGMDSYKKLEVTPFVLCKPNGEKLNAIPCTEKKGKMKFNDCDEISFTTYLYIDGEKNEIYDKVNELMHIELPDIGRFVITEVDINSEGTNSESKSCVVLSEEILMAQKYLELFIINKGTTGSVEQNTSESESGNKANSVNNVRFFNSTDQSRSLLHLILNEKCPEWSIQHVDNELIELERSFEVDRQDIYSFLTQDVSEAFECVFVFDTIKHEISAFSKKNVGEDTDIHISYANLAKTVDISSSTDDIKTCLTVKGKDDLNIREVNMGNDRIINIDYFHSLEYMSKELYDAYTKWKQKWEENEILYEYLIGGIIDKEKCLIDVEKDKTEGKIWNSSQKQAWIYYNEDTEGVKLINTDNEKDIQNYAWGYQRIYDKIHYLTYLMIPTDLSGTLDGKKVDNLEEETFKKYNTCKKNEEEKTEKEAKEAYKKILSKYGLNPLESKLETYKQKRTVCMESKKKEELENSEYIDSELINCTAMIEAINEIIKVRKAEINKWTEQQKQIGNRKNSLCDDLLLTNTKNFKKQEYIELQKFIREDELSYDNYLTNSLDTDVSRIDEVKRLLKYGREELAKVSVPTLSFSMDMANIYAIPEFQDKADLFNVGNCIYVSLRDDFSLKVRLLTIDINFLDTSDFSVTFGNVAKIRGNKLLQDVTDALSLASDAATSVSYNASNWNRANVESTEIGDMINSGLLNAGKSLKTTNSDVVIDQYGITISNNPTSDSSGNQKYPDDAIFLGGGQMLFTSDNFRSVKAALGRVQYTNLKGEYVDDFGLIAQFVLAGYISGSDIEASHFIGGDIKSTNYEHNDTTEIYNGTYINLNDGTFEFNGADKHRLTLEKLTDKQGKVTDYLLTVHGRIEAEEGVIGGDYGFTIGSNEDTKVGYIYAGGKEGINHANAGIYIGTDGISLGKTTSKIVNKETVYDTPFKVTPDGSLIARTGEIGGFMLNNKAIYKGKTSVSDTNTGVYIGTDGIALGASSAFHVTDRGVLTAKSGYIGGATITDGSIYVPKNTKNTRAIQNKNDVYWAINSDGTTIFTDVHISGVQSGSSFGSVGYDGINTFGNFSGNSYFSSVVSAPFSGTCKTHIEYLSSNYIKTNYLDAMQATINTINANYVTTDTLNAHSISASKITSGTINGYPVDWKAIFYVNDIRPDSIVIPVNGEPTVVLQGFSYTKRMLYVMCADMDID